MIARADCRALIRCLARMALVPAGALAVHQLRFVLAFGGDAGVELARQGHSYLHSLVPWIVLLIGVAAGAFLWALGRAHGGSAVGCRATPSRWRRCGSCARPACSRSTSRRSSSRGCSRPAIRRAWPASSATAAGGRSPPRCASAWCSRRYSTALAGCWTRSRNDAIVSCRAGGAAQRDAAAPTRCPAASALAAGRGLVGPWSSKLRRSSHAVPDRCSHRFAFSLRSSVGATRHVRLR